MFTLADNLRRFQGAILGGFGFAPQECPYRILASESYWRLRSYGGQTAGPALLIVAAPIKRPYIWDLAPSASAVRFCLGRGYRTYLLEWTEGGGNAGLERYADRAIGAAIDALARETQGTKPVLIGHSLGGTFAAIFAALEPERLRGLVLLAAPLCFEPGSSEFRDRIAAIAPSALGDAETVSGTLLSEISAMASPKIFLWERVMDGLASFADPRLAAIHTRVERWTLDEFPLPSDLVREVLQWLYRENRFCRETLELRGKTLGPSCLKTPVLAVVNKADGLAPAASVKPFFDAMPGRSARILTHEGESGVGLQHVAILAGPRAFAHVWPQISDWIEGLP